jgi:DNA-binding response OmpR family regulator
LLVEDEPRLRTIIQIQLMTAGYDVVAVSSGEAALEAFEALTPDLILLNILLPGVDGVEVCRRTRANDKLATIPVIFLTARTDLESRTRCMNAGSADYITKPWTAEDLVLRIGNAIALARRS